MSGTPRSFKVSKSIVVRTRFVGFHKWPEAPAEVAFLRDLHRHVFYVECHFRIEESRQLEFFLVQATVNRQVGLVRTTLDGSPSMSCEQMAELIANGLYLSERLPVFKVVVSEDNENDGVVELEVY